jgi:hypothetical protein
MSFEFCEGLLDGIEVRGIGWKQPQLRACRLDCLAYTSNLVSGEIVQLVKSGIFGSRNAGMLQVVRDGEIGHVTTSTSRPSAWAPLTIAPM